MTKIIKVTNTLDDEETNMLYKEIKSSIEQGEEVDVDFSESQPIHTHFLNQVFGSLVRDFDSETLNKNINIKNLDAWDRRMLSKVIENAKDTKSNNFFDFFGDRITEEDTHKIVNTAKYTIETYTHSFNNYEVETPLMREYMVAIKQYLNELIKREEWIVVKELVSKLEEAKQ